MAMLDYLTEIYNRRGFFKRVEEEFEKIKRTKGKASIIMCDIDKFKNINDTYGHDIGDIVLKHLTKLLQSAIRKYDILGRFGGEEFIILLSNVSLREGLERAEEIRKQIENSIVKSDNLDIKFTTSFGVSELKLEDKFNVDKVIKRADEALYISKTNGRNRVSYL